jgi:hypothetical protein
MRRTYPARELGPSLAPPITWEAQR